MALWKIKLSLLGVFTIYLRNKCMLIKSSKTSKYIYYTAIILKAERNKRKKIIDSFPINKSLTKIMLYNQEKSRKYHIVNASKDIKAYINRY